MRFAHRAVAARDGDALGEAQALGHAGGDRGLAQEGQRGLRPRAAVAAEHRPVVHRLRRRDAGIRVAHRGGGDEAAFQHQTRLDAEEGRLPEHQIGEFADLDAADLVREAVRERRVDRVLGDIALDARVVVARRVGRQAARPRVGGERAALELHRVRGLPGADDDLADAAHRLRVGAEHADRAEVVQHILGGDGFAPDAALGEGQVLGDAGVEVMADHQHVQVLIDRVDGVGHRRVGAAGQEVLLADDAQDVRRVAAARALGVEGAERAAFGRGDGVFDEARFVQRVAVDRDLDIVLLGHREAAVDRGRRRAPVFVQLQADGAGLDLLAQRLGPAGVALAVEREVDREGVCRLQHQRDVRRAGRAGGGEGAGGWAGAAAGHRRHARHQRLLDLLRADEVDMGVDAAGRDDQSLAGNDLGARADDDIDARLHIRVAGLADGRDALALDGDVGLDDAPVIDDHRVGDDEVGGVGRAGAVGALALAHAVADGLAAAELDLFAVAPRAQRVVGLDLDHQRGIGQPQPVADGGAEHLGIGASSDGGHVRCSPESNRESPRPGGRLRNRPVPPCAAGRARSARRCPRRCSAACRARPRGRTAARHWFHESGSANRPAPGGRRCFRRPARGCGGPG